MIENTHLYKYYIQLCLTVFELLCSAADYSLPIELTIMERMNGVRNYAVQERVCNLITAA